MPSSFTQNSTWKMPRVMPASRSAEDTASSAADWWAGLSEAGSRCPVSMNPVPVSFCVSASTRAAPLTMTPSAEYSSPVTNVSIRNGSSEDSEPNAPGGVIESRVRAGSTSLSASISETPKLARPSLGLMIHGPGPCFFMKRPASSAVRPRAVTGWVKPASRSRARHRSLFLMRSTASGEFPARPSCSAISAVE